MLRPGSGPFTFHMNWLPNCRSRTLTLERLCRRNPILCSAREGMRVAKLKADPLRHWFSNCGG